MREDPQLGRTERADTRMPAASGFHASPPQTCVPETGAARRELHSGMTAIAVVEILGAPRMVTHGTGGRETWTWDQVSSETIGTAGPAPGVLTGAGVSMAKVVAVIVRFDVDLRVSSVGVHAAAAAA